MRTIIISIIVIAVVFTSCGSPRRTEPLAGPLRISNEKTERGKVVFHDKCNKCHPAGEGGVGPSLNNIHLPKPLLKFRVRSKAFILGTGKMPSFKKNEISKDDLDALASYLKALRKNKKE